jgi:extradiol dioxygenase family protein
MRPFHLAFTVHDLAAVRAFYGELLGCPEGRRAETWIDSISMAIRSSPI